MADDYSWGVMNHRTRLFRRIWSTPWSSGVAPESPCDIICDVRPKGTIIRLRLGPYPSGMVKTVFTHPITGAEHTGLKMEYDDPNYIAKRFKFPIHPEFLVYILNTMFPEDPLGFMRWLSDECGRLQLSLLRMQFSMEVR